MKNIYSYLVKGIATAVMVYGIFIAYQTVYAKNSLKESAAIDSAFNQLFTSVS